MTSAADKKQIDLPVKANMPTALIAGGAGFIGSHLVETLLSQNFKVIVVDNLSTGKRENLKEVITSPNLTFIEADINNYPIQIPDETAIDYCFHIASIEEYRGSNDLSLDTLLVNSLGTRQLLEISKQKKAKFILISEADLYTGAISSSSLRYYFGKIPDNESILSAHEAKRFAEALAFEYYRKFNLPLTIIRLKDVYGARMNFERGDEIASLINEAIKKEPLRLYGDGLKIMNPTFVSDVVFGIVKASLGDFSGEIFILVNPEKVTVESLAKTLNQVAGPLEIEHKKAAGSGSFPFPHFDLENTREKIGWNPKVNLTEGIGSIIQSQQILAAKEEATSVVERKDEEVEIPISEKVEDSVSEKAKENVQAEPVTESKGVEKEVAKAKPKGHLFLRIAVFALSLTLLIATIVYPLTMVGQGSSDGRKSLLAAKADLDNQLNERAVSESLSAQNSFESAEKNLQNVNWLLNMLGLSSNVGSYDHSLAAGASLSAAIRSSAKANQILVDTAGQANLTPAGAKSKLNEALSALYTSRDKLEEAALDLEAVDSSKTLSLFLPDKNFVSGEITSLQNQVGQLITTIEASLAKNSR